MTNLEVLIVVRLAPCPPLRSEPDDRYFEIRHSLFDIRYLATPTCATRKSQSGPCVVDSANLIVHEPAVETDRPHDALCEVSLDP
jgi:hypothetical protein